MTKTTRPSIDALLTDALRGEAIAAPMPDDLLLVPDRSARSPRSVSAFALVLFAGTAIALAAIGTITVLSLFGPIDRAPSVGSDDGNTDTAVPIEGFDVEPRPGEVSAGEPAVGPIVDVARGRVGGRMFLYTVYRGTPPNDVCVQFEWPPDSSSACGSLPGDGPAGGESFGVTLWSQGSTAAIHDASGLVTTDVAAVWIDTSTGSRARAELVALDASEIDARLFIAFLPAGEDVTEIVAVDAAGTVIDRFDVDVPPGSPDVSAPDPTPAPAP